MLAVQPGANNVQIQVSALNAKLVIGIILFHVCLSFVMIRTTWSTVLVNYVLVTAAHARAAQHASSARRDFS